MILLHFYISKIHIFIYYHAFSSRILWLGTIAWREDPHFGFLGPIMLVLQLRFVNFKYQTISIFITYWEELEFSRESKGSISKSENYNNLM
jgi:hypothetical protein